MQIPVKKLAACVIAVLIFTQCSNAQLTLQAQLRTRTELRDGQGVPLPKGLKPALFTSQRTRLTALFNTFRLKLGLSIQDVRVWGQDVSTINRFAVPENNGIMLHEAWAQVQLTDTLVKSSALYLKIGRQELVYDDQRLLGNLDWLQQGRRHDAAVLKYEANTWLVHFTAAFNQNKETNSQSIYNSIPPGSYPATTNGGTMYKSLEFLYAQKKLKAGNVSFLFLTDQFNKYQVDSVKRYLAGSWSRATTGIYFNNTMNRLNITAAAYYQFGKDGTGRKLSAGLVSLATQYKAGKIAIGPGIDYTTGGSKNNYNHAFDPLYGTPHKFWGLMDYFYAANPFGNTGLVDLYLKSQYTLNERFMLNADLHHFASASAVVSAPANLQHSRSYGQEADLVGSYNLTKLVGFEAGYAHFFATDLLVSPGVKNVAQARRGANWAYLMVKIKPEFKF